MPYFKQIKAYDHYRGPVIDALGTLLGFKLLGKLFPLVKGKKMQGNYGDLKRGNRKVKGGKGMLSDEFRDYYGGKN